MFVNSPVSPTGARSAFAGQVCGRRESGAQWTRVAAPVKPPAVVQMVQAPEQARTTQSPPKNRTKLAIITGASSGIGMYASKYLVNKDDWKVLMAVRSPQKAEKVARELQLDSDSYSVMELDLASLESVRSFVNELRRNNISADTLVCNAATWHPKDKRPRYTVDGFEEAVAVNYLGHFLLVNLMLQKGALRSYAQRGGMHTRVVFIGTETHNPDTLPGKIPPRADLGDLSGFRQGFKEPIAMIDGGKFEPTKAYKDSKVCVSILMNELDRRYGRSYNVTFTTLFPGCVADSGLFREKRGWFRKFFPFFQKYVVKQYVTTDEAGRRAAAVASEPQFERGAAYWKWDGTGSDADAEEKPVSWEALDVDKARTLWDLSAELVDL